MGNRIILNGTSYFGRGSRENLITELNGRHFSKALIVTDRGLRDAGVVDLITKELDKNNFDYVIYDEVKPNPTVQNVKDGVEFCKNNSCDVIVAIGGGSSIDTAKGVSIIMTNPEHSDVVSLDGAVETKNPGMPIIALPTTAGTAAEVTINYVITDPERVKKMVCVDPHDIPLVAIIDQELMAKMPKSLAAYTGMDALTHAMEGYTTKAAWLMTDMYHLNAMALIYKNLEKAVNEKDDEAIDNVGLGQYIAGMGFSNVGLGIVHSMAYSLGAVYDTPHGLANAMILPHVLKFNGEICPSLFRNMGRAIGLDMENLTDSEAVNKVVKAVEELNEKLGVPKTLKEIGVKEEDIDLLAEKSINDACTPGNARDVSKEDIINLYKEMYN